MAIGPVITEGFGSFGSKSLVITEGFGIGAAPVVTTTYGLGNSGLGSSGLSKGTGLGTEEVSLGFS